MTHSATWLRSRVPTCPGHFAARAQNADSVGVFSQVRDILLSCGKYKSGSGSIVNHPNVNFENFGSSEWLWAKVWQNGAARDEEGSKAKEWCSAVMYSSLPLVARHRGPITLLLPALHQSAGNKQLAKTRSFNFPHKVIFLWSLQPWLAPKWTYFLWRTM